MAKPRIELHEILVGILGNRNVYNQPPENNKLEYPCIIYKLANIDTQKADDRNYLTHDRYELTLIHRDPENTIFRTISDLPYCRPDRFFVSDNLNHYTFTLYF